MGKRSRGSSATTNSMSNVPSSVSASTYGTIMDLKPGSPPESRAAVSALVGPVSAGLVTAAAKKAGRDGKNIWDEYYPLVQPAHQYHHRNDRGSSNYFFHGMFSADVMWAYRDAVIAYLVSLYSMVVLSLTGLVFCKQWGILSNSPIVFGFRCLWFVSPAIASLALRNSTSDVAGAAVCRIADGGYGTDAFCVFAFRCCSCEAEAAGVQHPSALEHSAVLSLVQELALV
jgi:hypothetical protein